MQFYFHSDWKRKNNKTEERKKNELRIFFVQFTFNSERHSCQDSYNNKLKHAAGKKESLVLFLANIFFTAIVVAIPL